MNKWLIIVLLSCMGSVHASWWDKGKGVTVPVATDLSILAQQAKDRQLPILLMVSQDHCPFCSLLKSDVLNPMLISGDYDDRVIITEILIDLDKPIKGFHGKSILPSAISAEYETWVTPTLLFIDYQGKEVHPKMIGVNTVEMYGFYLDESLEAALKAVRQGEPYAYKVTRKEQKLESTPER